MIKLSYKDTQYLMSYVQPSPDSKYQARLLCIFSNGFLTSDGFYKEVWAENRPSRVLTKPTIFNACAALDLPMDFKDHPAMLSKRRADLIKYIETGSVPELTEDSRLKFIYMERAMKFANDLIAQCPDDTADEVVYNTFNYEYSWCILWP